MDGKGKVGPWSNVITITLKMCEALERYGKKLAEDFFAAAGKKFECSFKKGLLMVKNFIPDFTTVTKHLIVLPYGEYRTEVYFYSNNSNAKVLETCVGGSAEVRPLYEIQHKFSNVTSGFIIKG
ncbi:uncharacterized protein LOC142333472 isoform X2 [Lycorma delicatula]|uniref:uncharacterized protein LOC142333472 isoform X2 n=1 Tax=Lycorma delicatula TaxID=130591 RepID=UPI003F50FDB6